MQIKEIYSRIGVKKPEKGEKRREFEPMVYCHYKLDLKQIVRLTFESPFDQQMSEIFADFPADTTLAEVAVKYEKLFLEAFTDLPKLPSAFRFFMLGNLVASEKKYLDFAKEDAKKQLSSVVYQLRKKERDEKKYPSS